MLENQQTQINKIKIVYLIPTLDQGGAERFSVDLILNLDLEKYLPTLILFKHGGLWAEELERAGLKVIVLNKKYKIDIYNFYQIIKELKNLKPKIIHTMLGGDLYGRLAAKILRIPIIVSTEQNLNPDENIIQNILKRITSSFANKIIAVSEAVKNDLIKRYRIPAKKVVVVYNGLNVNKFINYSKKTNIIDKEKSLDPESRKIILGSLGRLVTQKGQSVLINSLAEIKGLNFECYIAGSGPLEAKLIRQIDSLGLAHKVKLIGPVVDVPKFLNSLDIFILPSIWEGQGIVILEAALVELPIIASAVDGIKELLSEDSAYLVKPGQVKDLASKISWLINNLDSQTVKDRSTKLKIEIINRFSIEKVAREYQKLYQELLNIYENSTS